MTSHDIAGAAGTPTRAWADAVETFFREGEGQLDPMLALYDARVRFQDPIRAVAGLPAFAAMNRQFIRRARGVGITFGDIVQAGDVAFASWTMRVTTRIGPVISVDGVTHLRFAEGLIVFHRDVFDLGGSVAAALPVVGRLYRAAAGAIT